MDSTKMTGPRHHYRADELAQMSRDMPMMHQRLLATILILDYMRKSESPEDAMKWVIDTSEWRVGKSRDAVRMPQDIESVLSVMPSSNDDSCAANDMELSDFRSRDAGEDVACQYCIEEEKPESNGAESAVDLSEPAMHRTPIYNGYDQHPCSSEQPWYDGSMAKEMLHRMAVTAYVICFGSNPYLGRGYYRKVVISEEWEAQYWGADRTFAFDDKNDTNRPDGFYQRMTLEHWKKMKDTEFAELLKECLGDASACGVYANPNEAISRLKRAAYDLYARINTSQKGGEKLYLVCSDASKFILTEGKMLLDAESGIMGRTRLQTQKGRTGLYLTNESEHCWEVLTASGNKIDVHQNGEMPVRPGMCISVPRLVCSWSVETAPDNTTEIYKNIKK